MSDGEDFLLNEEFDYEHYDIDGEREDELLGEGDDLEEDAASLHEVYGKGSPNIASPEKALSDADEQDDVLSLDVEEDLNDMDASLSKTTDDNVKNVTEEGKTIPVLKITTNDKTQKRERPQTARNFAPSKAAGKNTRFKKNFSIKGRPNSQRRRGGTVLINPRYQGYVHVNDNNARLAWDNTQCPPNNAHYIQPWAIENDTSLHQNLISVAQSLSMAQTPLLQVPHQMQLPQSNLLETASRSFEAPLVFQPPPNMGIQNQTPQPHYYSTDSNSNAHNDYRSHNRAYDNNGINMYQPKGQDEFYRNQQKMPFRRDCGETAYSRPYNNHNYHQMDRAPSNNFLSRNNLQEINHNNMKNDCSVGYLTQGRIYNSYSASNTRPTFNTRNNNLSSSFHTGKLSVRNNSENFGQHSNYKTKFKQKLSTYDNRDLRNKSRRDGNNTFVCPDLNLKKGFENVVDQNVLAPPNKRITAGETIDSKELSAGKKIKTNQDTPKNGKGVMKISSKQLPGASPNLQDEDEEMKIYQLKIEEQKRQRDKILKMKEERRKQQMRLLKEVEVEKTPIVLHSSSINRAFNSNDEPSSKQFHVSTLETLLSNSSNEKNGVIETDTTSKLSTLKFQISNDIQQNTVGIGKIQSVSTRANGFMTNRVVVVKHNNKSKSNNNNIRTLRVVKTDDNDDSAKTVATGASVDTPATGQVFSSFFNNRKVLKKDNTLLHTRLLIVNNLSTSTDENKLMSMAQEAGEVQKLRLDKQERQATILFKSVASAHAFFAKYQRHILDLSVIDVKLEPML